MLAQFHTKVPMHFVLNYTNTAWQSETGLQQLLQKTGLKMFLKCNVPVCLLCTKLCINVCQR